MTFYANGLNGPMASRPNSAIRVLLLPALGTDAFLYAPLLAALAAPESEAVAAVEDPATWRPPANTSELRYGKNKPGESLRDYVRRQFREQFPGAAGEQSESVHSFDLVIGTSLGGMAAQELIACGLLKTEALVLISTCFSGRDMTWPVRLVSPVFYLLPYLPRGFRCLLRNIVAWLFPRVRRRIPNGAGVTAMIRRADPDLLFASGRMIARWRSRERPVPLAAGLVARTLHIQGRRDPVLSYRRIRLQREPEVTVATGDHIMILNRASELAGYIRDASFYARPRQKSREYQQ